MKITNEKPWEKFYPQEFLDISVPDMSLNDFLLMNKNMDDIAISYYNNNITWREIIGKRDSVIKSLIMLGVQSGDQIVVFLQAVPEFLYLLLAADKLGVSIVCRDGTLDENVSAIVKSNSKVIFVHDYLPADEEYYILKNTNIEHIIKVSPYESTLKSNVPDNNKDYINSLYQTEIINTSKDISWKEFLILGKNIEYKLNDVDFNSPLLCAYTTGTTGTSKQVIHSAHSIIGILCQMCFYAISDTKSTWLLTILPPSLIAIVVSMMLNPLASNKILIMDPFCKVEDLDLELMRYKPNCWALIPMFIAVLLNSKRIPEDFDMSFLTSVGAGAEPMNNKQIHKMQEFLIKHNCHANFSIGYGMSEAGSNCTFPSPLGDIENCNYGIPMPLTTLSVFEPDTDNELSYNEIGEICKLGPGIMLGYDNKEVTDKTLVKHSDGNVWLHTGDIGYMDENGVVHILNRGFTRRKDGGLLFALPMENKIADVKGIEDLFFVIVPDLENEGFYLPYLYVVLDDNVNIIDIEDDIRERLDEHEYPFAIYRIEKRPFFHFKTNRKEIIASFVNRGKN